MRTENTAIARHSSATQPAPSASTPAPGSSAARNACETSSPPDSSSTIAIASATAASSPAPPTIAATISASAPAASEPDGCPCVSAADAVPIRNGAPAGTQLTRPHGAARITPPQPLLSFAAVAARFSSRAIRSALRHVFPGARRDRSSGIPTSSPRSRCGPLACSPCVSSHRW